MSPYSHLKTGFTLVEVLVTTGIILILASIILPVTSDLASRANTVKCTANLRDIGSSMQMYATENDGFFPAATDDNNTDWDEYLKVFLSGKKTDLKKVFTCAGQKSKVRYGYNNLIGALRNGDGSFNPYRRPLNIINPAQKVLIGCVESGRSISINVPAGGYNKMALVHDGRAILLFADGHVAPAKDSELGTYARSFNPAVF